MAEQQLPDLLTPCSANDVYLALRQWSCGADRGALLIFVAQWGLETAWGKACHRWNLGNVKHVPGDGHDFVRFRASEIIDGQERFFDMDFVAFGSLDMGAQCWIGFLNRHYGTALQRALAHDVHGYAHELKAQGYYTADEGQYTRTLAGCLVHAQQMVAPDTQPDLAVETTDPTDDDAG